MTRNALLLFCDFLALRLRTENAELLRRIASEFLRTPPSFATVESMLQLSYPFIAITPVDREDGDAQERANAMLDAMRDRYRGREDDTVDKLHAALMKRVQLKNWFWLPEMFSDFCAGSDRSIERFVGERARVISLLPFAPAVVGQIKREGVKTESEDDTTMDVATESESGEPVERIAARPAGTAVSERLLRFIFAELQKVTQTKPWRHVFDLSNAEYPFNARKYPSLKKRYDRFWSQHAETVWRRHFWCKETGAGGADTPEHVQLLRMQRCAVMSFANNVIIPIYKTFGARFFVELDAQEQQHRWWWYRQPLVELPRVAMHDGVDGCLNYLKGQARKRFPKAPRKFLRSSPAQWVTPNSVWANLVRVSHIQVAVEQLKQASDVKVVTKKGSSDSTESEAISSSNEDSDSSMDD